MSYRRQISAKALLPLELAAVGRALYGPQWRAGLAADIGIGCEFEIQQMEAGRIEIPSWLRGALVALAQERAVRAIEVANSLILEHHGEAASQAA